MDNKNLTKHLDIPARTQALPIVDDREQISDKNRTWIPQCIIIAINVLNCFVKDAFFAFGNITNALQLLGYEINASFFLKIVTKALLC